MYRSHHYYTLISSLPHLPPPFEAERVPITPIRLEQRLKMLDPGDVQVVEQMHEFLLWDRQRPDRSDEQMIRHYTQLMTTIANPLVRHLIAFRMDVRTIMSGLRRRRLGQPPPPGVGPWVRHIRQHWQRPDFNLGRRYPWIITVEQLLDQGEALEVERLLLSVSWNEWTRLAERYHFSFEAVVLYLARWEVVDRWTRLDAAAGRRKLEQLVAEALASSLPE